MPAKDNLNFLEENDVFNSSSATTVYSNTIDLQGDNGGVTPTGAYGSGSVKPIYFEQLIYVAFTTITSLRSQLQTSDTITAATGNLSGTITTLLDSGVVARASIPAANSWFTAGTQVVPFILPPSGVKRYVQVTYTVVGPSSSEVGAITSYLSTETQSLQRFTYPVASIA